ncbi:MAG: hypothetical protein NDJ94_01255 [Vicinamibacteria bacterium]|nr:hypothetical protein [Vicinamibacteria bacterium]
MRHRSTSLFGFLLAVSTAAQTPPPPPPPTAAASPTAAPLSVVRGAITPKVECAAEPRFSYALYLPADYDPARKWPALFLFDPRERGPLAAALFKEAAALHGMILVSSNDTRSDDPRAPNNEAVMATWADAYSRLSLDPRRLYAGGFSGGARLSARVGAVLKGGLAGVIAVGAGLPPEADARLKQPFALYGAMGETDFNYTEMRQLEQQLRASHTPSRIVSFEGGHQWLPSGLALEALDWMALQAMAEDRTPTDPKVADRYRASVSARAARYEQEGRVGEALRTWEALADDLAGFGGSTAAVKEAERLGTAARKELERERAQVKRDQEWTEKAMRTIASLGQTPPPPLAQLVQQLDVVQLRQQLEAADRITALSATRRLSAIMAQANSYVPRTLRERGLLVNAMVSAELAAVIDPESPGPLVNQARAHALAGRKAEAIAALRKALEKGVPRPMVPLAEDPELASLRGDAEFEAILEELRKRAAAPGA